MLRLLAVLAVLVSVVAVHGKGVLRLADRRLVPGDTARVSGEKFPKASSLVLLLVGPAGRTRLSEVHTDTAGVFRAAPVIPADLPVGAYRLVALASDGDEVGALDVEVVPAATPRRALKAADGSAEPSAQALALERAGSPWVTGGMVAVILVAVVVGGLLLRRPTAHRSQLSHGKGTK
jgi:hypothetical protein